MRWPGLAGWGKNKHIHKYLQHLEKNCLEAGSISSGKLLRFTTRSSSPSVFGKRAHYGDFTPVKNVNDYQLGIFHSSKASLGSNERVGVSHHRCLQTLTWNILSHIFYFWQGRQEDNRQRFGSVFSSVQMKEATAASFLVRSPGREMSFNLIFVFSFLLWKATLHCFKLMDPWTGKRPVVTSFQQTIHPYFCYFSSFKAHWQSI